MKLLAANGGAMRMPGILVIAAFLMGMASTGTALAGAWGYRQEVDKMDSSVTKYATIESDNSMSLSAPYSGENRGRLSIRFRNRDGLNVIFQISKGQLICGAGVGCTVMVRFDGGQPVDFDAVKPVDYSSTTLFLQNERRFVELAKCAKQIRVAATLYQAGTQVLEFTTTPSLVWDQVKATTGAQVPLKPDSFHIKLSAFDNKGGASALAGKLKKAGYPAYVASVQTSRGTLWRVHVGSYTSYCEADTASEKLKGEGYRGFVAD